MPQVNFHLKNLKRHVLLHSAGCSTQQHREYREARAVHLDTVAVRSHLREGRDKQRAVIGRELLKKELLPYNRQHTKRTRHRVEAQARLLVDTLQATYLRSELAKRVAARASAALTAQSEAEEAAALAAESAFFPASTSTPADVDSDGGSEPNSQGQDDPERVAPIWAEKGASK